MDEAKPVVTDEAVKSKFGSKAAIGSSVVLAGLLGVGVVVTQFDKPDVMAVPDSAGVLSEVPIIRATKARDGRVEWPQGAEIGKTVFDHSFETGDTLVLVVYNNAKSGTQSKVAVAILPITDSIPADRILKFRDAPISTGLFPKGE